MRWAKIQKMERKGIEWNWTLIWIWRYGCVRIHGSGSESHYIKCSGATGIKNEWIRFRHYLIVPVTGAHVSFRGPTSSFHRFDNGCMECNCNCNPNCSELRNRFICIISQHLHWLIHLLTWLFTPSLFQFRSRIIITRNAILHRIIHHNHIRNKTNTIELEIGSVLGRGGFCTVYEVRSISLATGQATAPSIDDSTAHILQDRNYMAVNYLRNGKDARYAIKTLSSALLKDPERFVAGVIDLVIETKFLSIIRHPVSVALSLDCILLQCMLILWWCKLAWSYVMQIRSSSPLVMRQCH